MTCHIPGVCSKSTDCNDKHCPGRPFPTRRVIPEELTEANKRGFGRNWEEEQCERPLEASDGAVLAVLFLGIFFLFGVPLFLAWLER